MQALFFMQLSMLLDRLLTALVHIDMSNAAVWSKETVSLELYLKQLDLFKDFVELRHKGMSMALLFILA